MSSTSATTRLGNVPRRQAAFILIATAAALAWCLLTAWKGQEFIATGKDQRLYRRIVECVGAGEDYYEAAGREMRAAGYPTGAIFNWRPPLYAWLIGTLLGPGWARLILSLIAVLTLLSVSALMLREGGMTRVAAGGLPLVGAFSWPVLGDCFFFQELWAGILIALSLCCYARDRWRTGLATGLLALFFRELALPYCLIALFLAFRQQRRREIIGWLIGLGLFAVYMVLHGLAVVGRILPEDKVHGSWIQFGGAAFLLEICRMNAYLYLMPLWASALYLPLALLGLTAWRGRVGERFALTGGAYVVAFAVVGQPFNDYWGLLTAPLLACGFATAPQAVWELSLCVCKGTA